MKGIWMLAAVASLAACAGRGEDDMGAAPDRGDSTAVTTGADTTTMDTLNTGGMVTDTSTSNVLPATPSDTAGQTGAYPSDTTSAANPSGGYETTPPSADTSSTVPADPGMTPDTSSAVPSDTTPPSDPGVPSDSASVNPAVPTDSAATPQ